MAVTFEMKANDTLPVIEANLGYDDDTVPPLGTAQHVTFIMRKTKSGTAQLVAAAEVVDAATGHVRYAWEPGDTAVPGEYDAEWEVVFADGGKQTFPGDSYHRVILWGDLGNRAG